jgi:hypothetical protein
MFPASVEYKASIFTLMELQAKGRRMAMLPKGESLSQYVAPDDYARITALAARGAIPGDFDRKHPRQIIQELFDYARGEKPSKGFFSIEKIKPGTDPDGFVRSAVRRYNITLVPLSTAKLKPALVDVFSPSSTGNEQCLRAALALAEAGPGAIPARSKDWAERRVRDVLGSVAQTAIDRCRPASLTATLTPEIRSTVRSLLNDPKITVAVFDLPLLAQPGGLLDELTAAGFRVRGPAWK